MFSLLLSICHRFLCCLFLQPWMGYFFSMVFANWFLMMYRRANLPNFVIKSSFFVISLMLFSQWLVWIMSFISSSPVLYLIYLSHFTTLNLYVMVQHGAYIIVTLFALNERLLVFLHYEVSYRLLVNSFVMLRRLSSINLRTYLWRGIGFNKWFSQHPDDHRVSLLNWRIEWLTLFLAWTHSWKKKNSLWYYWMVSIYDF